ncbi:hypothetical protein D3C86_1824710 [compost metagenome]
MYSTIITAPKIKESRFKPPTFAIAGMKPFPMALKCSSLIIIVPVFSVTRSSAPLKMSIPAREATKDGIPNWATNKPLNKPTMMPNTKIIGMVM